MKYYYHAASKGLAKEILFSSPAEFIAGMNRVAICFLYCIIHGTPVQIIAFCLMDNHVHFILYGTPEACDNFLAQYKKLSCMWIRKHRGERLHEEIIMNKWPLHDERAIMEKSIYVLRNPPAARLKVTAAGYRWGTGNLMFSDHSLISSCSRTAGLLSNREKAALFNSEVPIPDDWQILPDGMIWPGCYVDYKYLENMFPSVGTYSYMLNDSNIDKNVNMEIQESVSLPDKEVKDRAVEIAHALYSKEFISKCSSKERIGIAKVLRKELRCSHKQLARIVRLEVADLEKLV